ncbi:ribosomal protein S6 kinase delta-1 [Anopheles bellator]|uniref:ribosomal protein S6 kinase delta-1 n=1 Tax=Anopheles bellator TaxID=139047 RepID=UPI002648DE34|nr:ribosomal protein S6 kinase delta-1 [Anopheles bellator]
MLVGRRKPETWVHSFSVDSETRRHKGFTIYRITSIVFPRSVPQALTRVILWKRFSEVKKLYKELVRRHRERHLSGAVPALGEQSYFKRFDPAVIEERRRYILRLLDYAGQEPVLYRSYAFVSFFAHGISPDDDDEDGVDDEGEESSGKEIDGSPLTVVAGPRNGRSNIATIRQSLGICRQDELSLIDPRLDNDAGEGTRCSSTSAGEVDDGDEVDNCHGVPVATAMDASSGSLMDSMISESGSISEESASLRPATSEKASEEAMDYLVDAAMVFSKAVEAEANGDYKQALDRYRVGIDRLLSGAKDDTNATRKKIAKEKSCKYVAKAEEIYERYLQDEGDEGGRPTVRQQQHQPMSPISLDDPSSPIQLLERPLNYLSRYKVVKVIGTVMQVQDVTDKKFYIMKSIRRPLAGISFSGAAVFPQDVPYMVPLVAFFQSTDGSIFLLLRLICAGKLWDFIRTYRKPESYCPSPEQTEEALSCASEHELEEKVDEQDDSSHQLQRTEGSPAANERGDSGYLELINQYSRNGAENNADRRSLHSTADKTEQSRNDEATNDDAAFATDEVGTEVQPDVEQAEAVEEEQQVIPSFDTLSKDMDVRELLSCSQQLLKAVTQTLEESTEQTTEPPLETEDSSAGGTSNSIEERHANSKSHSSQLVLAKRAGTSINDGDQVTTPQCTTNDLLPEGVIRRWISELVVAVDSLHFNGIVCGDLTMDNLLLGPEGQLMLTYFHRRVESYFTQTGATVPVAPNQAAVREMYVAPERPLEPKSDYWSVGVIMFEMLTKRPFVACHPSGVFCYHEVQYPEGVELSAEARELLEGLLQPDVERRFDFKQVIANPFFDSVDWGDVKRRGHGNS